MSSIAPASPLRHDAQVIGIVGIAHGVSHYSQLMLAPLFPWIKDAFGLSYSELGFILTVFYVVSGFAQMAAGFLVDRHGPLQILLVGLGLLGLAAIGYASSPSYSMMLVCAVVAGLGNAAFHPADYTLLNRKVSGQRLGHAYSVHGISGSLGWAVAPVMLVPIAIAFSWRVALFAAAALIFVVMLLVWLNRARLVVEVRPHAHAHAAAEPGGAFGFVLIPAVWMCFLFFLGNAFFLSGVQSFATEAARMLHAVPLHLAALCLTIYMIGNAAGMVLGGFLIVKPERSERIISIAFAIAAVLSLVMGFADIPGALVPLLFAVMGFTAGTASPSRDMLVKRAAPENATGRVFGVVYSGLDAGMAIGPLVFGALMDAQRPDLMWLVMAVFQAALIFTGMNVLKVRRTALARA